MFVITLLGGNAPLLVPLVTSLVHVSPSDVDITFMASPTPSSSDLSEVAYSVPSANAATLQIALSWVFGFLYLLSSVLYLISALMIARQSSESNKTTISP